MTETEPWLPATRRVSYPLRTIACRGHVPLYGPVLWPSQMRSCHLFYLALSNMTTHRSTSEPRTTADCPRNTTGVPPHFRMDDRSLRRRGAYLSGTNRARPPNAGEISQPGRAGEALDDDTTGPALAQSDEMTAATMVVILLMRASSEGLLRASSSGMPAGRQSEAVSC